MRIEPGYGCSRPYCDGLSGYFLWGGSARVEIRINSRGDVSRARAERGVVHVRITHPRLVHGGVEVAPLIDGGVVKEDARRKADFIVYVDEGLHLVG